MRDLAPVAGLRREEIAGPLLRRFETTDGERGFALAPLLARTRSPEGTRLDLLYPLGLLEQRPERWRLRLTPLIDVGPVPRRPSEAPPGFHWTFLLAFGGRDDAGQGYFGLFPLGGVARERFGQERIDFWLFPLFARSTDRRGFRRVHLLWPFFSYGSGGGRRMLRIWPFYGSDRREGQFERRYALWPLLHWRHEGIGGLRERRVRLLLPFYGESVRRDARARFLLGPLYLDSRNPATGARSRAFLWPLVQVAERPGEKGWRELRIEPFFRRRVAQEGVRTGSLLGAVEHRRLLEGDVQRSGWRLLWVSRLEDERSEDGALLTRRRELWPLWRLEERRAERRTELRFPWILPMRGRGFERSWLAPLTLHERLTLGDESRSDTLFGALRTRRTESQAAWSLAGLLRRERRADGSSTLSLFGIPLLRSD